MVHVLERFGEERSTEVWVPGYQVWAPGYQVWVPGYQV